MAKILCDKYPMGSFPYQKSDGKYIDGDLLENLRLLCKKVVDDMTWLGVVSSSTLEVGTGKTSLVSQIGEAWSYLMKEEHGIDIPFTVDNCVFKPKQLIEMSFKIPRYSFIFLDEWEDAHYWSELGMTLRQFFRKCRQLNLFMIAIIPNFFQLPLSYAVSRSVFFIDVKFEEGFERGHFNFYNFPAKKNLYINGKKFQNYHVCKPTFSGVFTKGYGFDEVEYKRRKLQDMIDDHDKNNKTEEEKKYEMKTKMFQQFISKFPDSNVKKLAEGFEVSEMTVYRWLKKDFAMYSLENEVSNINTPTSYNNNPIKNQDNIKVEADNLL